MSGPPQPAVSDLVRRFRALRWACKESDEEAAEALGVHVNTLRDIEAGKLAPPRDLLFKLAGFSGVPLRYLEEGGSMEVIPGNIAFRMGLRDPGLEPKTDRDKESQPPAERENVVT